MGAVMYRPNKIMKAGTWADPDFNGPLEYTADRRHGRHRHERTHAGLAVDCADGLRTLVQQPDAPPDGTVLASGGISISDGTNLDQRLFSLQRSGTPTRRRGRPSPLCRTGAEYHSTALLLADGRVLMAGGGALPGRAFDQKNAEIYSPPYLFKGARPTITLAPASAAYGSSFDVSTPNAATDRRRSR